MTIQPSMVQLSKKELISQLEDFLTDEDKIMVRIERKAHSWPIYREKERTLIPMAYKVYPSTRITIKITPEDE